MSETALIGIDWGTTSARAYRLAVDGTVLDTRHAPLGIQQVRDGRFDAACKDLLGDWAALQVPRIASGMIGSRQGWAEAPYVHCPGTLHALVRGTVVAPDGRLSIVPGLMSRDASGVPDVMRGEETQIVGAVDPNAERVLAVLPGTHSKWARIERGAIVDFSTYMTGELYAVLIAHSILGRMATPAAGDASPGDAYARGVERGLGAGGLSHDLFGARTLALTGELEGAGIADWLSGLLIGREIRNARNWAQRHGYDGSQVRVIGEDRLVTRYALALVQAGVQVEPAPSDAAARGLWRIAAESGALLTSAEARTT